MALGGLGRRVGQRSVASVCHPGARQGQTGEVLIRSRVVCRCVAACTQACGWKEEPIPNCKGGDRGPSTPEPGNAVASGLPGCLPARAMGALRAWSSGVSATGQTSAPLEPTAGVPLAQPQLAQTASRRSNCAGDALFSPRHAWRRRRLATKRSPEQKRATQSVGKVYSPTLRTGALLRKCLICKEMCRAAQELLKSTVRAQVRTSAGSMN